MKMNEDEARELAFAIIGEFEELLAQHNMAIPSSDREGRKEEACIYGDAYYELEDEITELLMKNCGGEE